MYGKDAAPQQYQVKTLKKQEVGIVQKHALHRLRRFCNSEMTAANPQMRNIVVNARVYCYACIRVTRVLFENCIADMLRQHSEIANYGDIVVDER